MKVTNSDKIQIENLAKSLRRAKFNDVSGEEVLAMAQMFAWVGNMIQRIQKELEGEAKAPPISMPSGSIEKEAPLAELPQKRKRGRPKKKKD